MMEMGKLWEDAAKTAEASVTSFLSRNSVKRVNPIRQLVQWGMVKSQSDRNTINTGFVQTNHNVRRPTFQHILLHLNLIELVGADNDTVASEVNTAAGL